MSTALEEEWGGKGPGWLPWWRVGRPAKSEGGEEITIDDSRPRIGMGGLSTVAQRPGIDIEDFLDRGAEAPGISVADLKGRGRGPSIVEGREILAWLGVELYDFKVRKMAGALDKHPGTASLLVSRAGSRRAEDAAFREKIARVDSAITAAGEGKG